MRIAAIVLNALVLAAYAWALATQGIDSEQVPLIMLITVTPIVTLVALLLPQSGSRATVRGKRKGTDVEEHVDHVEGDQDSQHAPNPATS